MAIVNVCRNCIQRHLVNLRFQTFRVLKYNLTTDTHGKIYNIDYKEKKIGIDCDHQYYADFKRLIKTSNVDYKDGYTCFQLSCKLCSNKSQQSLAYVNKRTGAFICPSCDLRLPLNIVKEVYEAFINSTNTNTFNSKYSPAKLYETKCERLTEVPQDVLDKINIKGLKLADLELLDVRYDDINQCLQFPLKNIAGRYVGEILFYLENNNEITHQNEISSGLLIHNSSSNKSKAIIVSTILDFLVLIGQHLDSYNVICLPYGLKLLPQECLPGLERFKSLLLWLNVFDSSSWGVAKSFAYKLDEKRCMLIRPTDTEPSPWQAYRKNLNIRQILQRATPVRHKSVTTFSSLRNDILSELQHIEKVNGVKWKRFPILNKLLKGHRKGELTIITGPTGSGKTTFMSEYSLDLALQGVCTLWGSFEIRNSRLASTLLRQFVGYSLEDKLHEFDHWATEFEKYPMYFMTFHGQQPLKVVMEAIEHTHYVHDITHVIIDNLQFMMGISYSTHRVDKFAEQDNIVAAFRGLATKYNIHVTLVMHPRKEREENDLTASSIFGSAKATQEADNVLIIQDKRLTLLRGKKYLQIVKNRYSGDLGIMPLEFNKEALSYSSVHTQKKRSINKTDKPKERESKLENIDVDPLPISKS